MIRTHYSQSPDGCTSFLCATCWGIFPILREGGTGYGIDGAGGMHCYSCCHVRDVAELTDRTRPFTCYLSTDGRTVSNWPGAELGRVHSLGSSRSGWHGSRVYRWHVRDVHGNWWQGRGAGQGMVATLRPMKRPDYAKRWGVR